MQIFSFASFGYEGSIVQVENDIRRGIPAVDIVGLADGAVKESRERMHAAICNSGFEFPSERVLISLSPADLKKEGAGFDLAMALSILSNTTDSHCSRCMCACAVHPALSQVPTVFHREHSGHCNSFSTREDTAHYRVY